MRALFVCTVNRCRSPTAEWLYARNPEHAVASAGVDRSAATVVDAELLQWAERVFVFERMHRNRIRTIAPGLYGTLRIECLYVPDDYEYLDPLLLTILAHKLTPHLGPPVRRLQQGGGDD